MSHRIRIKLKSFDHTLVDKSAEKIVKTVNSVKDDKVVLVGPIPLPTHTKIFTVNRSTFVNKKSREQFQLSTYKRLLDIYGTTTKTVEALMKLELPSGVDVEIKVWWNTRKLRKALRNLLSGALAQLVARLTGSQEVTGPNPVRSTLIRKGYDEIATLSYF